MVHTAKNLVLAVVLVAVLAGCASPAMHVRTSVNNYEYYVARHKEKCPGAAECAAEVKALAKWSGALDEASAALGRGGKFPLQLKALATAEKEMAK